MSLIIAGSTSGTITLDTPAVAGTQTATLPAATGTVMVSGNMPAFSAYTTGDTSVATSTTTKIVFNATIFNTASCLNTSTGTFTPNVAGYYQFSFGGQSDYQPTGRAQTWLYKNGAQALLKEENLNSPASTYPSRTVNGLLYANGTTDYFEIYVRQESGISKNVYGGSGVQIYFSACLVRAA